MGHHVHALHSNEEHFPGRYENKETDGAKTLKQKHAYLFPQSILEVTFCLSSVSSSCGRVPDRICDRHSMRSQIMSRTQLNISRLSPFQTEYCTHEASRKCKGVVIPNTRIASVFLISARTECNMFIYNWYRLMNVCIDIYLCFIEKNIYCFCPSRICLKSFFVLNYGKKKSPLFLSSVLHLVFYSILYSLIVNEQKLLRKDSVAPNLSR